MLELILGIELMRSIGIILAAFALTSILALGGDLLLIRLFPASFDDQGVSHDARMLGATLLYTITLSCLGGYLAAGFAPSAKLRHAVFFGFVCWPRRRLARMSSTTRPLPGITSRTC